MTVVLDTSAAVDVVLQKEGCETFLHQIETANAVISPDIYIAEITNVAWKYHKLANFTHDQSVDLANDGLLLVDKFIPAIDLWKEALRESNIYNHPVYDLLYLVCTRRNDAVLLTRDKKLKILCQKLEIETI